MKKRYKFDLSFGFGIRESRTERGVYAFLGRKRVELRERYNFEHTDSYSPDGGKPKWREPGIRGLYVESKLPLPRDLILTLTEDRKTYAEAVGYNAPSMDWILDEFDSSFNALAVASLKYHQDWSVCHCDDERRARYQDLIDRLSARPPRLTLEESEILHPPGEPLFEPAEGGGFVMRERSPEQDAISDAWQARRDDHFRAVHQARHDFVDVMPELWS